MKYQHGEKVKCPHCGEIQDDDPVQDFAKAGRVGPDSCAFHQCVECDEEFSVQKDADGTFDVEGS